MNIYIDNKKVVTDDSVNVEISIDLEQMLELDDTQTDDEYVRFQMPIIAHNIEIMGDPEQPLSTTMFNQTEHEAYIEQDGAIVAWGRAFLAESTIDSKGGYYTVAIRPKDKVWIEEAENVLIHESEIEYEQTLGGAMIEASWSGDQMVRFLPVEHDDLPVLDSSAMIYEVMSSVDYHPFIHAASFFRFVAEQSGYTIESEFIDSPYFDTIHFSGSYESSNCDTLIERMDFLAGRVSEATAVADYTGSVYANPLITTSSIGNIVDVVDPTYTVDGVNVPDAFTNNGCVSMYGSKITFVPPQEVTLAFEYDLSYTTDYEILDRDSLKCFDTITLHDGSVVSLSLANQFIDKRIEGTLTANFQYRIIIFDYSESSTYLIMGVAEGSSSATLLTVVSSSTIEFTTPSGSSYSNLILLENSGSGYTSSQADWAIYEGYIGVTGQISVLATVRSVPKIYEAGEVVYFSDVAFSGADSGMSLTLSQKVTLSPLFMQHPTVGSEISWEDVSAHELYQIDIIEAIAKMYDLKFYTNVVSKTISIEPYRDMVDGDNIIDFTDRADSSCQTTIAEMGNDIANRIELEYSSGDGSVSRWNVANNDTLGFWEAKINNVFSKNSLQYDSDVIFTPSIILDSEIRYTESAYRLQVGNRDSYGTAQDYEEDLNFPIKVVRYIGMKDLDAGEKWSWPSYGSSYPFVGFHYEGEGGYSGDDPNPESIENSGDDAFEHGFSLCFEDRDGVAGLHYYHDHKIDRYNNSKMITQYLFLEPSDIESIMMPNSSKRDWRSLYKIRVCEEDILCRLCSIEKYDPSSKGSTKCTFIKEV